MWTCNSNYMHSQGGWRNIEDVVLEKDPTCKGTGIEDGYGDGRNIHECSRCKGKGYLEKMETWI